MEEWPKSYKSLSIGPPLKLNLLALTRHAEVPIYLFLEPIQRFLDGDLALRQGRIELSSPFPVIEGYGVFILIPGH